MLLPSILDFLSRRIGLEAQSIGLPAIEAAIQERLRTRDMVDIALYRDILLSDPIEQEAFIEQLVVPETWFFRDQGPFDFLAVHARKQWGDFSAASPLRVLSLPCSTGEEPYSIAMTLLDAGNPPDAFRIDAIDISRAALRQAYSAVYSHHSFRGKNLDVLQRHFRDIDPDHFELLPRVRETVRLAHGTIRPFPLPEIPGTYHAIFCRNLLIYLNPEWRRNAVELFHKLLRPDGILFIGHADAYGDLTSAFTMARNASAFAYYPKGHARPPTATPQSPPPPTVEPISLPIAKPSLAVILHDMHAAIERQDAACVHQLGAEALTHTRLNPEIHYLLGAAHELDNNPAAAKESWQRSLYLHPRHLHSLQRLKSLLEREGDRTSAARLEARIQRVQTSHPEV